MSNIKVNAIKKFKSTMITWLCEHGYSNIEIDFEKCFGYAYDDTVNCINIGVDDILYSSNVNKYFEQFLYEYGCEYVGIPGYVTAFLHELGHVNTIYSFTPDELWLCYFSKGFDHGGSEIEEFFRYWEMPDEFAANVWVVNYINSHIEDVENLVNVFMSAWKELCNIVNPHYLVKG